MSLAEVLVASTVFLGMLLFVCEAVVSYLKASQTLMPQQFSTLSISNGLDSLCRAIRSASHVYAPDATSLASGVRPGPSSPLVLALRDPSGTSQVTGYYWDATSQALQQLDFNGATYDPQKLPQTHHKVADSMGFWTQRASSADPAPWVVRLEGPSGKPPWQTAVLVSGDLFP